MRHLAFLAAFLLVFSISNGQVDWGAIGNDMNSKLNDISKSRDAERTKLYNLGRNAILTIDNLNFNNCSKEDYELLKFGIDVKSKSIQRVEVHYKLLTSGQESPKDYENGVNNIVSQMRTFESTINSLAASNNAPLSNSAISYLNSTSLTWTRNSIVRDKMSFKTKNGTMDINSLKIKLYELI